MTLYHLYTAAGLVLALALVYRLFRCSHAWELVDKTEFHSISEECKRLGMILNNAQGMEVVKEIHRKKVVLVMRCPKCGAAKILNLKS